MTAEAKLTGGSKDLCGNTAENERPRKWKSKEVKTPHFIVLQKKMISIHSSERIEEIVCELEGLQIGCNIDERNVEAKRQRFGRDTKNTFMGAGKYDNKHGVGIMFEQEVATKNHRHRIHQRTGHHCHDRGYPPRYQTDERTLLALGIRGPRRRKNVQYNREAHGLTAKIAYRLLEETSMLSWDKDTKLNVQVLVNTHWTEETREETG